jgi:hypothetical protein
MRKLLLLIPLPLLLLAACTSGQTTGATNITSTSATLNASGSCDAPSGQTCGWYFQYGTSASSLTQKTATQQAQPGSNTGSANVTGLTASTQYFFQLCGPAPYSQPTNTQCVGPDGKTSSTDSFTTAAASHQAQHHYIYLQGTSVSTVQGLGYDYMDVSSKSVMDALPAGTKGVFWIGNGYNSACSWDLSDSQVSSIVSANVGDPKFSGIYAIADEPDLALCPGAPAAFQSRTALIHNIDPNAKTEAVIQWSSSTNVYAAFTNSVDFEGADPYPCNVNNATTGCDYTALTNKVTQAVNAVGASRLVPVFQLFGQSCATGAPFYRLPTASELTKMLSIWDQLVPRSQRPYDASYLWDHSVADSCPSLVDANGTNGFPDLQTVMKNYFAN